MFSLEELVWLRRKCTHTEAIKETSQMQMFKEVSKGSELEKEVTMERLHKGRFRNRRTVRDLARARLRSINLLLMHFLENVENHMGDFNGLAWK